MAGRKKLYGFAEVTKHNDREDCWVIISGKIAFLLTYKNQNLAVEASIPSEQKLLLQVYDVRLFMEEHPGGDEVLLVVTGKDATTDLDDIGHSKAAKETISRYYIGDIDPCTLPAKGIAADALRARRKTSASAGAGLWFTVLQIAVPVLLLGLALAIQKLAMAKKEYEKSLWIQSCILGGAWTSKWLLVGAN